MPGKKLIHKTLARLVRQKEDNYQTQEWKLYHYCTYKIKSIIMVCHYANRLNNWYEMKTYKLNFLFKFILWKFKILPQFKDQF